MVKLLVAYRAAGVSSEERNDTFPSPVLGSSVNSTMPMSGDVHLYADPAMFQSHRPMLYADCECLNL